MTPPKKIDEFISSLKFPKLAAYVVPKLMLYFAITGPEAVSEWKKHRARMDAVKTKNTPFSFCEAATAGPLSPWHIRPLTAVGRKLGGGADTIALCGRTVSWDIQVEIDSGHLTHCCTACAGIYQDKK